MPRSKSGHKPFRAATVGALAVATLLVAACSNVQRDVVAESCHTYQDMLDVPGYLDGTRETIEGYARDAARLANRSNDEDFAAAMATVIEFELGGLELAYTPIDSPDFRDLSDQLEVLGMDNYDASVQLVESTCTGVRAAIRR